MLFRFFLLSFVILCCSLLFTTAAQNEVEVEITQPSLHTEWQNFVHQTAISLLEQTSTQEPEEGEVTEEAGAEGGDESGGEEQQVEGAEGGEGAAEGQVARGAAGGRGGKGRDGGGASSDPSATHQTDVRDAGSDYKPVSVGSVNPSHLSADTEGYAPPNGYFQQSDECDEIMRMWMDECAFAKQQKNKYAQAANLPFPSEEVAPDENGHVPMASYIGSILKQNEQGSSMAKSRAQNIGDERQLEFDPAAQ